MSETTTQELPVKAVLFQLNDGEVSAYRLLPKTTHTIDETTFVEAVAATAKQDAFITRFFMDAWRLTLANMLGNGCKVDLGSAVAHLAIRGSMKSATDQPNKKDNPVRAVITFKPDFQDAIAAMFTAVNSTLTVDAVLYEVKQDNVAEANHIESTEERIVANGTNIKMDAASEDNGVWLENLTTGVRVATATIDYSDSSTCHFKFATLPASGEYRLVLATRNGEDAETYALKRLTRNVTVVND